jgi:hypothetical protein
MAAMLRARPMTTLWRAIESDRRPMLIASTTRSIRSTVMTTSAVSDDTVAPADPMAIPTSASASAGASLMPSPIIATLRRSLRALSDLTTPSFSSGVCRANTRSAPIAAPTAKATVSSSPETSATYATPLARSRSPRPSAPGRS